MGLIKNSAKDTVAKVVKKIVTQAEQAIKKEKPIMLFQGMKGCFEDDGVTLKDPGHPPMFVFMPRKLQIVRMILKATTEEVRLQ